MDAVKKAHRINTMKKVIVDAVINGFKLTINVDPDDPAKNTKAAFEIMRQRDFAYDALDRAGFDALRDLYAFIRWAETKRQRVSWIASNLMHDLSGFLNGDECFSPRTSGYFKKYPTLIN